MLLATERLLTCSGHTVAPFAIWDRDAKGSAWSSYFPRSDVLRRRLTRTRASLASVYSFETRRGLKRLLKRFRPDVAHLHNVYEKLTFSIVDALVDESVPIVMTVHDYRAICPSGTFLAPDGPCERCLISGRFHHVIRHGCLDGPFSRNVKAALEAHLNRLRRQYDKIDVLFCPSKFLVNLLSTAGFDGSRLRLIPNPVEERAPRHAVPAPARFIYFGRLVDAKGLEVLLDAMGRVDAGVRLSLFGKGPLERRLAERISSELLPVDLEGHMPHAALMRRLDGYTAAILPSLWYENAPMAILEAQASGLPVIASDLGAMREFVTHSSDGLLVPSGDAAALADALNRLSRDPARVTELGRAARQRVRGRHSSTAYLNGLLRGYAEAVGR